MKLSAEDQFLDNAFDSLEVRNDLDDEDDDVLLQKRDSSDSFFGSREDSLLSNDELKESNTNMYASDFEECKTNSNSQEMSDLKHPKAISDFRLTQTPEALIDELKNVQDIVKLYAN